MKERALRRFFRHDGGAVAATYALALVPIIAVGGLAYDYARVMGMDSELQNAADQAALAGATQLDRTSGSMERAIAAAQGSLVTNKTYLSNDSDSDGNTVTVPTIVFYKTKADAEAGTDSFTDTTKFADAGFIGVQVKTRRANYAFTPIVGAISGDMTAGAVAGMGSAVCRIPPLMICNPDEPLNGGNGDPSAVLDIAAHKGQGLKAVRGSQGKSYWEPGNFGYLDVSGGAGGGTPEVRDALGSLYPNGACLAVNGAEQLEVDTETGAKVDATDSLNTRFDAYDNTACVTGAQCPASINSRKDLVRLSTNPPDNGNGCKIGTQGWQEVPQPKSGSTPIAPFNQYLPTSTTPLPTTSTPVSMGHPQDICHAVDSSVTGYCNTPFGNGIWDRDAYFRSHYIRTSVGTGGQPIGSAWTSAEWKTNTGLAADVSRYDVYRWEIDNIDTTVDGVKVLDQSSATYNGKTYLKQPKPVCSQQYGFSGTTTVPDRRVLSVAVVNCKSQQINGNSTGVSVKEWIDVFLVQPSYNRDSGRTKRGDIYVEIIRKSAVSSEGNSGTIIRRDVPYLIR